MSQPRFLTADWNNILMLNYAVDASLLERFVPAGTELDPFEGKNYLSLVGFEFNRTRIFDLAVPFHQSFEEVNLRFYVKRSSKRGVVFADGRLGALRRRLRVLHQIGAFLVSDTR